MLRAMKKLIVLAVVVVLAALAVKKLQDSTV
jgi:type II secretory pathway pseudopilin PulG